jgi:EAL domain-containing protein (putative c-di-GMP-specific phosphodiesterase class I)
MSNRAIVEGVETKDELRALLGIGADLLQGYLFGMPGEALRPVGSESFDV